MLLLLQLEHIVISNLPGNYCSLLLIIADYCCWYCAAIVICHGHCDHHKWQHTVPTPPNSHLTGAGTIMLFWLFWLFWLLLLLQQLWFVVAAVIVVVVGSHCSLLNNLMAVGVIILLQLFPSLPPKLYYIYIYCTTSPPPTINKHANKQINTEKQTEAVAHPGPPPLPLRHAH